MISKLRRKIFAINIISISIVYVIAIAFIFAFGYTRLNDERVMRLNGALALEAWQNLDAENLNGMVVAEYDHNTSEITWLAHGENVHFDPDVFEGMVKEIVANENSNGWIGLRVLYAKRVGNGVTRIALFDRDSNLASIILYVLITVIALTTGLASYLFISVILSHVAIRPVAESWKMQKQFVADASHELKTPLSVIMANTDLVASHPNETVASQMQWIENARAETARMAELVNDLLFLAKSDDGVKTTVEVVDMSECIERTVLTYEAVLYENGKSFDYEIAPHLQIRGNEGQLKQLATILLDNANKYSRGVGNIKLNVGIIGKNVEFSVSNDCDFLTEEQLEHLFDRFYTVDQSRTSSGNGLGLSIAQVICQTHGGKITATYLDGRITFTATLPQYKQKQ
ncbi:MAG: HAMP domain-containing histidine kinase [Clostridiales bacterium]|nr:HAMP domain-containing histidine kinase [Clostridiales bacterium]